MSRIPIVAEERPITLARIPVAPERRPITLAYSVDADDAFMFHALRAERIDTRGLVFQHLRGDTAELNALAGAGGADVVAISAGAYPLVADRYLLLPHGASVGRNFGPVVVARRPMEPAELAGLRVGVPGVSTTAWMVLRMLQPAITPVVIPIAPFARIFNALDIGEIDAALLIHEGRMLYETRGYHKVVDLGEWWHEASGLPLPLGVNVIRRALGPELVRTVSDILRQAIGYALAHRDEVIRELVTEDRGEAALAQASLLDRYLALYANEDTRAMAPDVRRGIDELFERARSAGLLEKSFAVEWAP
jgi:1,4-dihydroxy-6-naphthoate synthase